MLIKLLLPFFICLGFFGCPKAKKPTDVIVTSKIAVCYISNYGAALRLTSNPMADTAFTNAHITWGSGNDRLFQDKLQFSGYIDLVWDPDTSWYDNNGFYHNFADTVITISLVSNLGSSQGSTQLPGNTTILYPEYGATLTVGQVKCIWSKAIRANWYFIGYDGYAIDSSNVSMGWLPRTASYTMDTTYTIPEIYFSYPSAKCYVITFYTNPCRGPLPESGSIGNMTGTINGYLIGEGIGQGTRFYLGTRPKNTVKNINGNKLKERTDFIFHNLAR